MKPIPLPIKNKTHFLLPHILRRWACGIIALFLIFLPFQISLVAQLNLPQQLLWIDELFVFVVSILSSLILFYQGRLSRGGVEILVCLLCLGTIGVVTGLAHGNLLKITLLGTLDYIKNFWAIFAISLFPISEKWTSRTYQLLHRLALLFCFFALFQEIAFLCKYPVQRFGVSSLDVRFGLLRTPSLMGHPNMFGLNSLLFFVLDFGLHRRIRWQNLLLASGVFLSISRAVWIAFLASFVYLLVLDRNRKIVLLAVLLTIIMGITVPVFYFFTAREMNSEAYFRGYALGKSLEIFRDHPIFGVGPGMYGGVISFVFDSPLYTRYNFSEFWMTYMKVNMKYNRSIDQFWPQILAEVGLLGTFFFAFLLFKLSAVAKKMSMRDLSPFRRRMLRGFSAIPIVLVVYLFGNGLNQTLFLLTYCVLFGMVLGIKDESPSGQ